MFPEETHVKILARIDRLEANAYQVYASLERLRLELQQQWRAMPDGQKWTPERHAESNHSRRV